MNLYEWLMLLVLSLLWGASFFFIEIALTGFSTLTIVALRVGLAALVLWGVAFLLGCAIPRKSSVWLAFLIMGIVNNVVPFVLIVWGQTMLSSGLTSILNASTPIFAVLIAGLFLTDEPITKAKLRGSLVGLAGVIFLIGPEALGGLTSNLVAQLAVLGGSLAYAVAGTYGRRFRAFGIDPVVASAGQLLAAAAILIPVAIIVDRPLTNDIPGWEVFAAVLALAVLSTAIAYVLYFRLLETAGVTNLMLVTFLIPVTAIILGTALLDERLRLSQVAGMVVIVVGLSIIDGRLWQRRVSGMTG